MNRETDLIVGRVLKPWGREGAVLVAPFARDAGRFERLGEVQATARACVRPLHVEEVRVDRHGRAVVRFAEVHSIEGAEALKGAELWVAREQAERPAGESYFHHELVGLEVWDGERALGRVDKVLETGGAYVLVVEGKAGEVLIPFARGIV